MTDHFDQIHNLFNDLKESKGTKFECEVAVGRFSTRFKLIEGDFLIYGYVRYYPERKTYDLMIRRALFDKNMDFDTPEYADHAIYDARAIQKQQTVARVMNLHLMGARYPSKGARW